MITYTIKFENNGLGNKPSNINLVTSIPNSLPELTEDGYRFLGWYTNAALTNKVVKGETINSDIILYAKWETITYTISFNNYGIGTKPSSIEANRLPNPLPALTGETHILMGWYYDASFTDQAFADDLITTNTTLYAKWYEYVPKPERSRFYTSSSSSAVITNGSGMSQTITYSTSPGWRQIECDITNYNTAYESIEIKFKTPNI